MVDSSEIFTISSYIKFAIAPSVVILLVLALLQRRAKPNICGRRWPSLVVPMRFLDGYEDRLAYALCFGAIAAIIIKVFTQTILAEGSSADSPDVNEALFCGASNSSFGACKDVWVRTLLLQTQSLLASLVCAPHFVCITTPFKFIGALFGFGYSVFWAVFYIFEAVQNEKTLATKFGTLYLMRDVPIILCFVGLCIRSVWVCFRCYATKTYSVQIVDNVVVQHQVDHVAALLQKVSDEPTPPPEGFVEKIKAKFRSQMFPHFKIPARIVCIAFVQLIIIYYLGIGVIAVGLMLHKLLKTGLESESLKFFDMTILHIMDGVYTVSFGIGILSAVIYIVLFVINYRINMMMVYKGKKHSFSQKAKTSPTYVAQSLRLPGYQIAYIIWGFILLSLAIFCILSLISLTIYTLDTLDMLSSALDSLLQTLSIPLSTIAIFYIQIFLVRMFLLQPKVNEEDASYPLNVDNRRLYEVVSYVLVFSNLVVGLASALFRTCKSFILGIIFLGRLDRCLLMKGFETLDPGYMAYVGTLLVDNAHNNPVMRGFCAVLLRLTCKVCDKQNLGIQYLREPDRTCSNSRAARRWHLAYTLINNPDLLPRRKLALLLTRGLDTGSDNNESSSQSGTGAGVASNRIHIPPNPSRPISGPRQLEDSTDYPSFKDDDCVRLASMAVDHSEAQSKNVAWGGDVTSAGQGRLGGILNSNYTYDRFQPGLHHYV